MSWNHSASLEISLPYQAVYQYLLDNPVSGPSFVPTVIAALHPSNIDLSGVNKCQLCRVTVTRVADILALLRDILPE